MERAFSFSWRRRLKVAAPPLAIALSVAGMLAAFGGWGSWRGWAALAIIALLLARAGSYLWWGRRALWIDERGVTRSGRTVEWNDAALELRALRRGDDLALREVVLWEPRNAQGERTGVGFDESLEDFEQAVRLAIARVPETSIAISAPGEAEVRGPARERLLEPLRPTPAERALRELGRGALGPPPGRGPATPPAATAPAEPEAAKK